MSDAESRQTQRTMIVDVNLDLEMLRSFAVVAEEGHVGRAARRLFISQPALSKRIRRMETLIGVRLVQPEGRGITLTPAGAALAGSAPSIVKSIEDAVELTRGRSPNSGQ